MSIKTIVINYGSPRSGTTFLSHVFDQLSDSVLAFKLTEARILHPCQSEDGLIELHTLLRKKHVVLVRTVRHPMEVAESFLALQNPATWPPDAKRPGLANFTNARFAGFVTRESENTALQRPALLAPDYRHRGLSFIEIRYEDLADGAGQEEFARLVAEKLPEPDTNFQILVDALRDYGENPVGVGRLFAGGGVVEPMGERERSWFAARLAGVAEREGYLI